jgi:hypothetical protein
MKNEFLSKNLKCMKNKKIENVEVFFNNDKSKKMLIVFEFEKNLKLYLEMFINQKEIMTFIYDKMNKDKLDEFYK